jgi:hypothetical protein
LTCIVGLIHEKTIYIGGDSAGVAGYSLTRRKDSKVFRNGEFLIGGTSSFRMIQLLRYAFTPPALPEAEGDLARYMVVDFVNALRACLKEGGYATKHNEVESGGTFLIGVRKRLFKIENDYQVGESQDGYDACGCGEDLALGSLFHSKTTYHPTDPEMRVRLALAAAEYHNVGVASPFIIEKLE